MILLTSAGDGRVHAIAVFGVGLVGSALMRRLRSLAALDGERLALDWTDREARDRQLEVITIAQPKARRRRDGRRLSLSYINFYLAIGGLVMPQFDAGADNAAARVLAQAFPGREVVLVDALDIVEGGGGIHCITQQQPAP